MPTYDYKCNSCSSVFEHFQSMKDDPLKKCLCGKEGDVTRMISQGSGIIFKGSGFYVTDYKKASTVSSSESSSSTTSKTATTNTPTTPSSTSPSTTPSANSSQTPKS